MDFVAVECGRVEYGKVGREKDSNNIKSSLNGSENNMGKSSKLASIDDVNVKIQI